MTTKDASDGTAQNTAEQTQADTAGEPVKETQDTEKQFNAGFAKGSKKAKSELLSELGLDSVDQLKAVLSDYKSQQDEKLSSAEKLAKRESALKELKLEHTKTLEKLDFANTALKAAIDTQVAGLPDQYKVLFGDVDEPTEAIKLLGKVAEMMKKAPAAPIGGGQAQIDGTRETPDYSKLHRDDKVAKGLEAIIKASIGGR